MYQLLVSQFEDAQSFKVAHSFRVLSPSGWLTVQGCLVLLGGEVMETVA